MKKKLTVIETLRVILTVVLAFAIGYLFLTLATDNPEEAFRWFLTGSFSSQRRFVEVLNNSVPLMLTGLAISIVFQTKIFNIGAEGQFFFGAFGAMVAALSFPKIPFFHVVFTLITSSIFGAMWAFIPAVIKSKWRASELVSSLMMNYISYYLVIYLVNNYFRDRSVGALVSYKFPETAWLAVLSRYRLNSGFLIAIAICVLTGLMIFNTRYGYEIRVVGANKKFSFYSGIKTTNVIFWMQIFSGALSGLAGGIEISAMYRRFVWQSLPGYGFDGIIVAILARNNPFLVIPAALFIAYMRIGASVMGRMTGVAPEIVVVLQGIMILLITAEALLFSFKRKIIEKESIKDERFS